jgi:8-oxo-dGTP diphosphatase
MVGVMEATFCPRCGTGLEMAQSFGKTRPVCPECGYVHFDDPKVATGIVVARDDAILLALRNHEPAAGRWSFPSGYVDREEKVEDAAVREAREETGLLVEIDDLLGVFSEAGSPVIFIAYAGHVVGGKLLAGEEAADARFFPFDQLPDLPFDHDYEIIARWRRRGRDLARSSGTSGLGLTE